MTDVAVSALAVINQPVATSKKTIFAGMVPAFPPSTVQSYDRTIPIISESYSHPASAQTCTRVALPPEDGRVCKSL